MTTFACSRCGACCRLLQYVPELRELAGPDGTCVNLRVGSDGRHSCAVYESRPLTCRVDENRPAVLEPTEWHRRTNESCERLHLRVYNAPLAREVA